MMERLDLNSIQKTELLVSSAAKDKILIKPKRTSTKQPPRKQHDTARRASLPTLAEEISACARVNKESVSGGGTSDEIVTVSSVKPQLATLTSGQTKMATSSGMPGNRLRLFTSTVIENTGDSLLISPTTTTTLTPLSPVTTPTSPSTKLPPSGKHAMVASWVSQTDSSDQLTSQACSSSAHKNGHLNEPLISPSQLDNNKAVGEVKAEINIKSMMNRFQPPLSSNKSSPSRSAKGAELETNAMSSREESHTRPGPSHEISLSVQEVKPAENISGTSPSTTVTKIPTKSIAKLQFTSFVSVDSPAISAHEASWVRRKRELHDGDANNKSATATNIETAANNFAFKSATATNSLTTANSSVSKSGTASNLGTAANSFVSKSGTATNSLTTANSSVSKSGTASNLGTAANSFVSKSGTASNLGTAANSFVSKSGTTASCLDNSSVSKPGTTASGLDNKEDNLHRWSSRLFDQPSRKMTSSCSLESKVPGLDMRASNVTTVGTHSTQVDTPQTTTSQTNSMKTSRSFFDCSSRLNTQTNTLTINTCKSTTDLKSKSQACSPSGEADRKQGTSDDEHSRVQRHTGMSAFHNKQTHAKVVSSASAFNLPSSSWGNKTHISIVAPNPDSAATAVYSSGAATMAAQQSSCMQTSLAKPVKNLASSSKFTGVSSQSGSIAATNVSTGAPRFSSGNSNCAMSASLAAGQATPHLSGFSTRFASPSVSSTPSSHIASAKPSVSVLSATVSPTNTATAFSPLVKSPALKLFKPQIPPTTPSVRQAATPNTPIMSTTPTNKLLKTNITDVSIAGDKTIDTGVKVPPWKAHQSNKEVKVEIIDRKLCNHGSFLEPSKKSQPATDAAIIEQTDKMCGKPSKVLSMVKNFQNCQVPS